LTTKLPEDTLFEAALEALLLTEPGQQVAQEVQRAWLTELLAKAPQVLFVIHKMAHNQKTDLPLDFANVLAKAGLLAKDAQGWYLTDKAYELANRVEQALRQKTLVP